MTRRLVKVVESYTALVHGDSRLENPPLCFIFVPPQQFLRTRLSSTVLMALSWAAFPTTGSSSAPVK